MSKRDLAVKDLMTTNNLVVLTGSDSLERADVEMRSADIRHLPIVDAVGHVIGMISNRDVLAQFHRTQKDRIPLDRIMSGDVLTVRPDTLAREAVALLIEKKVDALPVVDEDGKLVGILTATDFLELAFRALHGVPYTPPRAET